MFLNNLDPHFVSPISHIRFFYPILSTIKQYELYTAPTSRLCKAVVGTHCVEPVLLARCSDVVLARGDGDDAVVPAQALTAILSALNWAMCRLSNSSCWLHLWFCSRRCWFCASKSRSLFVTHSLMRAALASTIFASWSLSWRCNSDV